MLQTSPSLSSQLMVLGSAPGILSAPCCIKEFVLLPHWTIINVALMSAGCSLLWRSGRGCPHRTVPYPITGWWLFPATQQGSVGRGAMKAETKLPSFCSWVSCIQAFELLPFLFTRTASGPLQILSCRLLPQWPPPAPRFCQHRRVQRLQERCGV